MKRLAILMAACLIAATVNSAFAAAPKQNSSCTKIGSTALIQGGRLKCTKVGNKLIWKRANSTAASPKKPLSSEIPMVPGFAIVRDALFDIQPDMSKDPRIKVISSPGVSLSYKTAITRLSEESSRYFQNFFVLDRDINVWLIAEGESSFVEKILIGKSEQTRIRLVDFAKGSVGGGQGGVISEGDAFFLVVVPKGDLGTSREYLRYLVFHEMAHVFQWIFAGYFGMQANVPCWYGEGFADLFGYSKSVLDKKLLPSAYVSRYQAGITLGIQNPSGGFFEVPKMTEIMNRNCPWRAPLQYELGAVIAEKFLIDYGLNGLLRLTNAMGDVTKDEAFNSATGMTLDQWYEKNAAPYAIALLQGKESMYKTDEVEKLRNSLALTISPIKAIPRSYGRNVSPIPKSENAPNPEELSETPCTTQGEWRRTSKGEYQCQLRNGILIWSKS